MRSADQRFTYVDFEIEVGAGLVRAQSQLAGETRARFELPYSAPERDALRQWLQHAISASRGTRGVPLSSLRLDNPQRVGEKLFDALFPPAIYQLYDKSRAIAIDRGLGGIRLKLRLLDDVAHLPWELLYDKRDDYLALSPQLSLVRYLEASAPIRPVGVDGPLRILLLGGAPEGLQLTQEIGLIRQALQGLQENGTVIVDVLEEATLDNLYERMRNAPFHVLHYMGHSEAPSTDAPARLLLNDGAGGTVHIEIDGLWRILRRVPSLRLIWLNSCDSAVEQSAQQRNDVDLVGPLTSAAARFVASGVPAVVANQLRISDHAALILAGAFYTNLAEGMPVDVALAEARVKVSVSALNSLEWATPVLYMRAPDGVLFQPSNSGTLPAVQEANPQGNIDNNQQTQPSSASGPPTEDQELRQLLTDQLRDMKRRLAHRELQRARYGISVEPSIVIEIEDLTKDIARLQKQLDGNI